ncbi:Imm50 family immunity protein [Streptomyces sp. NPDC049813]|uniref:Imm50 family immunity protein n=1 Tax=Streptomyces sp. NPDC049813 TaxID=3365597 RepID=UPI00378BA7DE
MRWTSALRNPEGINSVFQGEPPDLRGVHVHEMTLQIEGPTLKLRLDLAEYPEQPPRKWSVQRFNTVQIEISFSGLRSVSLTGFENEILADVILSRENGESGVNVSVMAPGVNLQATASTASISKLTAYADEK